jgi:antitoxin HicB
MNSDKSLAYYLDLSYTTVLRRDEEGDFVAKIDELPGCSAHGPNQNEALERLKEAQQLWIEDAIEAGDQVPEPEQPLPLPSGKWVQRIPRSLHQKLVQLAKKENVSLNQLVTSILAEAVETKAWVDVTRKHAATNPLLAWLDPSHPWEGPRVTVQGDWVVCRPAKKHPELLRTLEAVRQLMSLPQESTFDAYAKEITEHAKR